jgi:hypothetical protein
VRIFVPAFTNKLHVRKQIFRLDRYIRVKIGTLEIKLEILGFTNTLDTNLEESDIRNVFRKISDSKTEFDFVNKEELELRKSDEFETSIRLTQNGIEFSSKSLDVFTETIYDIGLDYFQIEQPNGVLAIDLHIFNSKFPSAFFDKFKISDSFTIRVLRFERESDELTIWSCSPFTIHIRSECDLLPLNTNKEGFVSKIREAKETLFNNLNLLLQEERGFKIIKT